MSSIAPPSNTRRQGITTDSWITPKWIIDRLGTFDLDPCACEPQPCNPPYGRSLGIWLERMALHNNGIALVFARTDTRAFHDHTPLTDRT